MIRHLETIIVASLILAAAWAGSAAQVALAQATNGNQPVLPNDYSCSFCHRQGGELWTEATPTATEKDLAHDVHWKAGLSCHDCHGGSPSIDEFRNHRDDPSFRSLSSRADIPSFCGHCHSDIEYMRQFDPSARTDQEAEYWTSGHGHRLKASAQGDNANVDQAVATCVDCHGGHGILAVKDTNSPVYPTRVAATCAGCHSDAKLMADRTYDGRPLGHDQYANWKQSVHGRALLEKGDLSAPACNDCHGNHGAIPPGVTSVANACGTCHGKVASLFAGTRMKHKFEEVGLPGCATCHGTHLTTQPSDEMLGMQSSGACFACHNPQNPQHGATTTGAETARNMRARLDQLKRDIAAAKGAIRQAERLGMEVRELRFDLRQADDALTNARTLVHSFKPGPMETELDKGLKVAGDVRESAAAALQEHSMRRVWLGLSLIPILLVVVLLLRYIRTLPVSSAAES